MLRLGLFLAFSMLFFACREDQMEGRWQAVYSVQTAGDTTILKDLPIVLTLKEEGHFTFQGNLKVSQQGDYEVNAGKLYLRPHASTLPIGIDEAQRQFYQSSRHLTIDYYQNDTLILGMEQEKAKSRVLFVRR